MKIINDELYELKDIGRGNIDVSKMNNETKEYYYLLYSYYSNMLIKFLIKNTPIKEVDNDLLNNSLRFVTIKDSDKDFYQLLSDELNFLYLRNNLYLNRFTKEEMDFLRKRLIERNYEFDQEMNEFIKSTFMKIIDENMDSKEIVYVNFGPMESNRFAPSNSLVIGIRYNEMENGLEDKEWYENYKDQKKYIKIKLNELIKEINQSIGCECNIFEYNNYTVKKLNNR